MSENKKINDDLRKLNEKETDKVSGGVFGCDKDHADGHELSCFISFHSKNECAESPDGYHFWVKDDANMGHNRYCKYCREVYENNPSAS